MEFSLSRKHKGAADCVDYSLLPASRLSRRDAATLPKDVNLIFISVRLVLTSAVAIVGFRHYGDTGTTGESGPVARLLRVTVEGYSEFMVKAKMNV